MVLLAVLLVGCAGALKQVLFVVEETYRSGSFNVEALSREGIAVIGSAVPLSFEEYRQVIPSSLSDVLVEELPEFRVVRFQECLSRINRAGKAVVYRQLITDYGSSGVLSKREMNSIEQALGVRYYAVTSLVDYQRRSPTRLSVLGLKLATTRECTMQLMLEIWDSQTGELFWQAWIQVDMSGEAVAARTLSTREVCRRAWRRLIRELLATQSAPDRDYR